APFRASDNDHLKLTPGASRGSAFESAFSGKLGFRRVRAVIRKTSSDLLRDFQVPSGAVRLQSAGPPPGRGRIAMPLFSDERGYLVFHCWPWFSTLRRVDSQQQFAVLL